MYILLGILTGAILFLLFTGSIKITYRSKKENDDIVDFLSQLIEGDTITTFKFNDTSNLNFTRLYTVVRNDAERQELYLRESSYSTPFIASYRSSEFRKVVEKNGDVVINIIERNKAKKDEGKDENND